MRRFILSSLVLTLTAFGCDDGGSGNNGGGGGDGPPPDGGPIEVSLALQVDPAARACEVMLTGPVSVQYGDAVEGRHLRRGDRLALAFAARADAALANNAVALASTDPDRLAIESGACFDLDGRPLAAANLALIGR